MHVAHFRPMCLYTAWFNPRSSSRSGACVHKFGQVVGPWWIVGIVISLLQWAFYVNQKASLIANARALYKNKARRQAWRAAAGCRVPQTDEQPRAGGSDETEGCQQEATRNPPPQARSTRPKAGRQVSRRGRQPARAASPPLFSIKHQPAPTHPPSRGGQSPSRGGVRHPVEASDG